MLDAICTLAYGLTEDDLRYILQDTDHPTAALEDRAFASSIDSKRFWLTDRERPPEIRHSVLSLVAFRELERVGLDEFLAMNDGAGWMLPGTLRLADYGLGHDDRAKAHQPVACRLGERFLPWQLEQGVEESWEECRRHAALIERIVPSAPATTPAPSADDLPVQKSLFGDEITPAGRRKKRG